jgi:putative membrane protein
VIRLLGTVGLVAIGLAGAAAAQTGNPAGMSPDSATAPGAAQHQLNQADRTFVQQAAIGGRAEVEAGNLAAQKGQAGPVKEFGKRMVQDHGKANDRLAALAKTDGVALPSAVDEEHRAMHEQLEKASGGDFDRTYIQGQIADHQKTAQLFEWEINAGQNAQLKSFASEVLPIVMQHLEMAQAIATELASQAPAAPASGSSRPAPRPEGTRR